MTSIPDTLDFTDKEIAKLAKRVDYAQGIYCRWIVTDAKKNVNDKSGNFQIQTKVAALKNPDDANSREKATVFNNLTMPKVNPDFPGHKAPNTAGLVWGVLHAMFPEEVPLLPRKEDGVLKYKGEEIAEEKRETAELEARKMFAEKLKAVWANPKLLLNQAFYAVYDVGNDPNYRNILNPSAEKDDTKDLTAPEDFFPKDEEEEAAVAPEKAGAKALAQTQGMTKGTARGKKK